MDNILIDEARTPLIISGPSTEATDEYYTLARVVRQLSPEDYEIEERTRSITLTDAAFKAEITPADEEEKKKLPPGFSMKLDLKRKK